MDTNLVLELLRAQNHIGDALAVAAAGDPERPDRFVLRKIRAANERLEIAAKVAEGPDSTLKQYVVRLEKRGQERRNIRLVNIQAHSKEDASEIAGKTYPEHLAVKVTEIHDA